MPCSHWAANTAADDPLQLMCCLPLLPKVLGTQGTSMASALKQMGQRYDK